MAHRGKATKGKRYQSKQSAKPVDPPKKSKRFITWGLGLVTVAALIGSIVVTSTGGRGGDFDYEAPAQVRPANAAFHTDFELEPKTLNDLLDLPNSELHKVDIARMNLLCATRLPATRSLDVEHALSVLDEWAEKVAFETNRHLYRIHDPRFADRYKGSEAHFRAEMLAQVLYEDLGVRYDKSAIGNFSFADPSVAFIHGMIPAPSQSTSDTLGGTCVSMPVLYVAVGRRLGYPLKLATAHSHIFARWDGEALYQQEGGHDNPAWRETFNCETTNGFHKYDDEYYKTWPFPVSEREIARNGLLKSLNAKEEFAQFLAARGHHGMDVKQYGFAARCYENAYGCDNSRPCYRAWLMQAAMSSDYQPTNSNLRAMVSAERTYQQHLKRQQQSILNGQQVFGQPNHPGFQNTIDPQADPFGSSHLAGQGFQQPASPTQFYQPPTIPE